MGEKKVFKDSGRGGRSEQLNSKKTTKAGSGPLHRRNPKTRICLGRRKFNIGKGVPVHNGSHAEGGIRASVKRKGKAVVSALLLRLRNKHFATYEKKEGIRGREALMKRRRIEFDVSRRGQRRP